MSVLGIDLGTTNSVVATSNIDPHAIADDRGRDIQPSIVSFHPNGKTIIGEGARARRAIDPQNTIFGFKRLIGRTVQSREAREMTSRVPFVITEGPNQQPIVQTRAGEFATSELSALVLGHLSGIAAKKLGGTAEDAVITVPASFNDAQRSATASAGAIAGLNVLRIVNEPTAAALAFGHRQPLQRTIAIYDFGGGTFDVTVLMQDGPSYAVLGTAGDSFLGGEDIDERIVHYLADVFLRAENVDLREDKNALQRVRNAAEAVKIQLSQTMRAVVDIPDIAYGDRGRALTLHADISREQVEDMANDLVQRTFPVLDEAMSLAQVKTRDITDIVMVGGTTRMPLVRDRVSKYFQKSLRTDVDPDRAVALGAALHAEALAEITVKRPMQVPPPPSSESGFDQNTSTDAGWDEEVLTQVNADDRTNPHEMTTAFNEALDAGDAPNEAVRSGPSPISPPSPPPSSPRSTHLGTGVSGAGPTLARVELKRTEDNNRVVLPATPIIAPGARRTISDPPPVSAKVPPIPPTASTSDFARTATGEITSTTTAGFKHAGQAISGDADTEQQTVIPTVNAPSFDTPEETATTERGPSGVRATNRGFGSERAPSIPPPPGRSTDKGVASVSPPPAVIRRTDQGLGAQTPPAASAILPSVTEVTPHALSLATIGGFCDVVIQRNTRIPTQQVRTFVTSRDNQSRVVLKVCQGNSRRLHKNSILGDLVLERLPQRQRGEVKIEVNFSIDPSGIIHVSAVDSQTRAEQSAELRLLGVQSADEVAESANRMRRQQ